MLQTSPTAIIIRTSGGYVAISDFGRMIARNGLYGVLRDYVEHLGYDVIPSRSRSGEAILEKSGFQKMKRTL